MKIIVNILLTTVISLSFIACEDKKEFKDTLKIEKVKLEKPKWERKLILADDRTEEWYKDADYSEVAAYNIANTYSTKLKANYKAIEWYLYSDSIKKSIKNSVNLAITYEDLKQYNKALFWYKNSYDNGNVEGATASARLYKNYLNNIKESELWYQKAITKGSLNAIKGISDLYIKHTNNDIKASSYLINLLAYKNYQKHEILNRLKNEWKLSDETIKKGYELQLTMPGLPKRYTGGI